MSVHGTLPTFNPMSASKRLCDIRETGKFRDSACAIMRGRSAGALGRFLSATNPQNAIEIVHGESQVEARNAKGLGENT